MKGIKRVCVAGAGAIGSLFAAHLPRVVPTVVLTRREDHAAELNRNGLRVSGKTDYLASVTAGTNPIELGDVDLVIIACKAGEVGSIAQRLEGAFPSAIVMTVQNGIGCEELVARHGRWPVLSAVTFMSGVRLSDSHVQYELDTATWLGPWFGGSATYEQAQEVESLLIQSGLKAEAFRDLRPAQWSKLLFNSTINSVAAITDLPHTRAFVDRESPAGLGNIVYAMIEEGRAVARAQGIELHEDPWQMNVEATSHGATDGADYAHAPSMLEDVRAKRKTEIDWITGAIVRAAREHGVAAPVSETLYALVKARETSWTNPDKT